MSPLIKGYSTTSSGGSHAAQFTCALAACRSGHVIHANWKRRVCTVAATVFAPLLIATASVAWAGDTNLPNGGRAGPVSIADLDISTLEGQLIAQERVRNKARGMCSRMSDPLDLGPHEHYMKCVATATDQAMRQVLAAGFARATHAFPSPDALVESQAQRAHVSLTDLDLSTAEGVRAAHERLHDMARRLCAQIAEESEISQQPNFVKCVGHTMATARIDVKKLPVESSSGLQLPGPNR